MDIHLLDTFEQKVTIIMQQSVHDMDKHKEIAKIKQFMMHAHPSYALKNMMEFIFPERDFLGMDTLKVHKEIQLRVKFAKQIWQHTQKQLPITLLKKMKKGMRVVIHGYHKSIEDMAKQVQDVSFVLLEGLPALHSKQLLSSLVMSKNSVHYTHDSCARIVIKEADMLLLCGSVLYPDVTMECPVGAEMFAEIANIYRVPTYALIEGLQYSLDAKKIQEHVLDSTWHNIPPTVHKETFQFEYVKITLLQGIITELGILAPQQVLPTIQKYYHDFLTTTSKQTRKV